MDRDEFETLQANLRTLERKFRTAAVGWVLSLVALVVLAVWVQQATSQSSVVRTRRVEITDDVGQPRITLEAVGKRPSLWLYDPAGHRRIGLSVVNPGVPVLWLLDSDEGKRMELSVLPDGAGALVFSDAAGRTRLWLKVGADGSPALLLNEQLARPRILLKVLDDGRAGLWLFDTTGGIRFSAP